MLGELPVKKKRGRIPGSKNFKTLEREKVNEAIKQRIYRIAQSLISAQESIAKGTQMLYKIETDSKGKKSKPILITDPEIIGDYLDGEYGEGDSLNTNEEYYYISTQLPNNQALDSLMNRALGRPSESLDITSKGQPIVQISDIVAGKHKIKSNGANP